MTKTIQQPVSVAAQPYRAVTQTPHQPVRAATVPRLVTAPAKAPAIAKPVAAPAANTQKQRERELTQRYAEGDADAAVELAQLLFAQGRTATGETVLGFAVRKGHPRAIQLQAERQRGSL